MSEERYYSVKAEDGRELIVSVVNGRLECLTGGEEAVKEHGFHLTHGEGEGRGFCVEKGYKTRSIPKNQALTTAGKYKHFATKKGKLRVIGTREWPIGWRTE